jgi:hypothetical protein
MDPHIWTIIAKYSKFREVVTIRSLCRRIRQLVFHLTIPICVEVDDNILKLYLKNIQRLDAYGSPNITDESIKHLTNLRTLDVGNTNITDDGIKNLTNLQKLYAYNLNITDEGIEHLTNLQILFTDGNPNITDEGIKHLTNLQQFNGRIIKKN